MFLGRHRRMLSLSHTQKVSDRVDHENTKRKSFRLWYRVYSAPHPGPQSSWAEVSPMETLDAWKLRSPLTQTRTCISPPSASLTSSAPLTCFPALQSKTENIPLRHKTLPSSAMEIVGPVKQEPRLSVRASVSPCVRACVCVCAHASVCPCVRACVCVLTDRFVVSPWG